MTIYTDGGGWHTFNKRQRYWFARLILEAVLWNNSADSDEVYDRILETPHIGRLNTRMRDAAWGRLLLCACYKEPEAQGALLESASVALIEILKEAIFTEIDLAECFGEEEEGEDEYCSRARNLCKSICEELDSIEDTADPLELNTRRDVQKASVFCLHLT